MRISQIYTLLHQVRKERGLSQREVAKHLVVEQATISLYESGKRCIPLELLDQWLELFDIEVKITQKDHQPIKGEEETKSDLEEFDRLKRRRNYLIAELRSQMAVEIAREPEFQDIEDETGENAFWSYSFYEDVSVGVVETRRDHPKQKYLAVEYTDEEVNVYSANRFTGSNEGFKEREDIARLEIGRAYFSEDDFLTLGGQWKREELNMRKITVLRKNVSGKGEREIVNTEGFSLRSLLDMQNHHEKLDQIIQKTRCREEYKRIEEELQEVNRKLLDLAMDNCLANGTFNPQFVMWNEQDQQAIDVPLWSAERTWYWIEEGIEWSEELQEIQLTKDDETHEPFYTHRHENGNRVIGLIGVENNPALFKSNLERPNAIYRVEVKEEDLNEDELADYRGVLKATEELETLRQVGYEVEEEPNLNEKEPSITE